MYLPSFRVYAQNRKGEVQNKIVTAAGWRKAAEEFNLVYPDWEVTRVERLSQSEKVMLP